MSLSFPNSGTELAQSPHTPRPREAGERAGGARGPRGQNPEGTVVAIVVQSRRRGRQGVNSSPRPFPPPLSPPRREGLPCAPPGRGGGGKEGAGRRGRDKKAVEKKTFALSAESPQPPRARAASPPRHAPAPERAVSPPLPMWESRSGREGSRGAPKKNAGRECGAVFSAGRASSLSPIAPSLLTLQRLSKLGRRLPRVEFLACECV